LSAQSYVVEETSVPVEREDDSGVSWRTLTSADRTPTRELTSGVCEIEPGGELVLHRHPFWSSIIFWKAPASSASTTSSAPSKRSHRVHTGDLPMASATPARRC